MARSKFYQTVTKILSKYENTTLPNRWDEAISFGQGVKADSFWIRDSEDVVNIVWLNSDGIRDITRVPDGESMFNFVLLDRIATFEVRERENIGAAFPFSVAGHLLVRLILNSSAGHLYWVANTKNEAKKLKQFLAAVLSSYAEV